MWFREVSPWREQPLCAFADIRVKEQGEIRALQGKERDRWEGGKSPNSVRIPASLSCQADGRRRNMTWSYCWGRGWWYKNYSTWIIAGSIGRQSHYGGARVQRLPGAQSGDTGIIFITTAMCNAQHTGEQLCSYTLLVALISKSICSSCIDCWSHSPVQE